MRTVGELLLQELVERLALRKQRHDPLLLSNIDRRDGAV